MPQTLGISRFTLDPLRHTLGGAEKVVQFSGGPRVSPSPSPSLREGWGAGR
jgi:hypothetical protein